jgi:hypothetical protein
MRLTAWVVVPMLLAGAPAVVPAQTPAPSQGGPGAAPTKARAKDEKRFSGIAAKLGTTPQALAEAFAVARQQDPMLKHKDFMVANVLAHNLGGANPRVTTPALLAGLKNGKTLRQTLVTLGLTAADAKAAHKAASNEVEEVDPKAADKPAR